MYIVGGDSAMKKKKHTADQKKREEKKTSAVLDKVLRERFLEKIILKLHHQCREHDLHRHLGRKSKAGKQWVQRPWEVAKRERKESRWDFAKRKMIKETEFKVNGAELPGAFKFLDLFSLKGGANYWGWGGVLWLLEGALSAVFQEPEQKLKE